MTRKEAINLLKQVNHILVNDDDYWTENTREPLNTAFDMAIKALEQGPILDKVRAEMFEKIGVDIGEKDECVITWTPLLKETESKE